MNRLMAVALLLGSWAAVGARSNNATAEPQSDTPVTVPVNQSTRVGQSVSVKVTTIQDSRCPANAMCIHYGSANVAFILERGSEQQTGTLCLGECGQGMKAKDTTSVQLGDTQYRVVLSEVRPYPGLGTSDSKPEAVIQLLQ